LSPARRPCDGRYWQVPFWQCFETQSLLLPQAWPLAQLGEQAGVWQVPAMQISEPQSELSPHGVPLLQFGAQPGGMQSPL
jgi:hypothetical protein